MNNSIIKKWISVALAVIFIFSAVPTGFASESATDEHVDYYQVPVFGSEYSNETTAIYGIEGKYYISISDAAMFTRFLYDENDSEIILSQGVRGISINKATGHLVDCDIVDQGNIVLKYYEGRYLCEAIPMLTYLGADISIIEDRALLIVMPNTTLWEALMPDYTDYYFNVAELYGGKNQVCFSLAIDILADLLNGINWHEAPDYTGARIEAALTEILKVDMMKYSTAKTNAANQNQKNNSFIDNESYQELFDTSVDLYDQLTSAAELYKSTVYYAKITRNDKLWRKYLLQGNIEDAVDLFRETSDQINDSIATENNLQIADNMGLILGASKVAFDTVVTSIDMMNYDADTKFLLKNCINSQICDYTGYDVQWINEATRLSDKLSSNASIITSAAFDNLADFAVDLAIDKGILAAVEAFSASANIYMTALSLSQFITSILYHDLFEAYNADMNAIWLSVIQYDIASMASIMLLKERDEYRFQNKESLEKLRDMFALYYRTTIAFCENFSTQLEEFGGRDKNYWTDRFSGTDSASYANTVADYLWKITDCTVNPIPYYSTLNDNVLSDEFIDPFSRGNDTNPDYIPNDAVMWNGHYYKVFDLSVTWSDAKAYCEENGGYLATITSFEEQSFINSIISNGGKNLYWIGLYKSGEDWLWENGETLIFQNWADGEPNNVFNGTESVCEIYGKDHDGFHVGEWNDSLESGGTMSFWTLGNTGFICEWDSEYYDTWMNFIQVKGWRNRSDLLETIDLEKSIGAIDHWFDDDGHTIEFLIVDLDNDDIPELILSEHHWDINTDLTVWRLSHDTGLPSIVEWKFSMDGSIENNQWVSEACYSKKYNAVVFRIGRPMVGEYDFYYCTIEDGYLVSKYVLTHGGNYDGADESAFYGNGVQETLTEDEFYEYESELWYSLDSFCITE